MGREGDGLKCPKTYAKKTHPPPIHEDVSYVGEDHKTPRTAGPKGPRRPSEARETCRVTAEEETRKGRRKERRLVAYENR